MKTLTKPRTGVERGGVPPPRLDSAPTRVAPRARCSAMRPTRPWLTDAVLPLSLCLMLIGAHLTGVALLNWESARRAWLEKEVQRLQQQNEVLRTRLNTVSADPIVRRWAESQGMVRAETQPMQTVQIRHIADGEPQGMSAPWRLAHKE